MCYGEDSEYVFDDDDDYHDFAYDFDDDDVHTGNVYGENVDDSFGDNAATFANPKHARV